VSSYPGAYDVLVQYRIEEFLREAEENRLAEQVVPPGRSIRFRIADGLRAAAQWVEGSPQLAGAS